MPLDEYNHALAALRYLVASLDERRPGRAAAAAPTPEAPPPRPRRRLLRDWMDDSLWTPL
jgi:hypothetical protein